MVLSDAPGMTSTICSGRMPRKPPTCADTDLSSVIGAVEPESFGLEVYLPFLLSSLARKKFMAGESDYGQRRRWQGWS